MAVDPALKRQKRLPKLLDTSATTIRSVGSSTDDHRNIPATIADRAPSRSAKVLAFSDSSLFFLHFRSGIIFARLK
ncbi:hypothetical protein [Brevundimonas sp. SPF441]|uniref:hypothetical protein n=1 Tax=Brevundimonas sp. SPF441 TaxID=2663795 RepID=UPI00129E9483|nr:hypothetical protein [Brevundimonas sp. SPF441]MRL68977.1 hypothetical protein [Brevundimonas sp. SPF441]